MICSTVLSLGKLGDEAENEATGSTEHANSKPRISSGARLPILLKKCDEFSRLPPFPLFKYLKVVVFNMNCLVMF